MHLQNFHIMLVPWPKSAWYAKVNISLVWVKKHSFQSLHIIVMHNFSKIGDFGGPSSSGDQPLVLVDTVYSFIFAALNFWNFGIFQFGLLRAFYLCARKTQNVLLIKTKVAF